METTLVLIVALSVAIVVVILGLVFTLLYYKMRNDELKRGLGEFLAENRHLREELQKCRQNSNLLMTGR